MLIQTKDVIYAYCAEIFSKTSQTMGVKVF